MKNPSCSTGQHRARVCAWLALALLLVPFGCSSSDPTAAADLAAGGAPAVDSPMPTVDPALGGAAPPADAPEDLAGDGLTPVDTPVVPTGAGAPPVPAAQESPEDEDPDATETNFLTAPCRSDEDCGDDRRCVDDDGLSFDARTASDADVALGRCVAAADAG